MIQIFGTLRCPDCVECCDALDKAGIAYELLDFDKDLKVLKEFLKIRDASPLFETVKKEGNIGIPCLIREDGGMTFDWKEFM